MGERRAHAPGKSDIVITPDWCAKDMVDYFRPTGRVLDPCRGPGVFHDLLPKGSPWCEITEGRDFFVWDEAVDWVIGNPPYSATRPFVRHAMKIADHVAFLIPLRNFFSGYGFVRETHEWGGVLSIRVYGTGSRLGFPMGNAIGAVYWARDFGGQTTFSFYDPLPNPLAFVPEGSDQ